MNQDDNRDDTGREAGAEDVRRDDPQEQTQSDQELRRRELLKISLTNFSLLVLGTAASTNRAAALPAGATAGCGQYVQNASNPGTLTLAKDLFCNVPLVNVSDEDCGKPIIQGTPNSGHSSDGQCDKPTSLGAVTVEEDIDCNLTKPDGGFHSDKACGSIATTGSPPTIYTDISCNAPSNAPTDPFVAIRDDSCGLPKNPGENGGVYQDISCNMPGMDPGQTELGFMQDDDCGLAWSSGLTIPHRDNDCCLPTTPGLEEPVHSDENNPDKTP